MKKLTAIFLTFILTFSMMTASALGASKTPISSIDLTDLSIGEGWAGKTVSSVKSDIAGYSGYASRNISFVMILFADSNLRFLSDSDSLAAGNSYIIQLVLKADDGYYFNNNKEAGSFGAVYSGAVAPEAFQTVIGSYMSGNDSIGLSLDTTADQIVYINLIYRIELKGHVHEKGTHHDAAAPSCEAGGTVEYWDCTGCDKKLNAACEEITEIANGDALGHSFDTAHWQTDETEHWHAATCEHTEEKDSVGSHQDGDNDHKCDVCQYVMSECTDKDGNHICDVCGRNLSSPQTGDNGGVLPWAALLAIGGAVLTGTAVYGKKKTD